LDAFLVHRLMEQFRWWFPCDLHRRTPARATYWCCIAVLGLRRGVFTPGGGCSKNRWTSSTSRAELNPGCRPSNMGIWSAILKLPGPLHAKLSFELFRPVEKTTYKSGSWKAVRRGRR